MKKIIFSILTLGSLISYAAYSGRVSISDTLMGFDKKNIQMNSKKGFLIIPKEKCADTKGLVVGVAKITCELTEKELYDVLTQKVNDKNNIKK